MIAAGAGRLVQPGAAMPSSHTYLRRAKARPPGTKVYARPERELKLAHRTTFLRISGFRPQHSIDGKLRELRAAELGRKHQYRRGRKPQRTLHGGADSGWFAPLTDRNLATARGRSIGRMEDCQCTLAMRFSFGLRGMTCRYIHRSWSTPLCTVRMNGVKLGAPGSRIEPTRRRKRVSTSVWNCVCS